ncbi:MAG: hypothetical protein EZS28_048650, partial [Streblomastix strix]
MSQSPSPLPLNQLAFKHGPPLIHIRFLISTKSGNLLMCDSEDRIIEFCFRLHSHQLSSVCVLPSFCLTGSEKGFVNIWPLDFRECYLEQQLQSQITSISASPSGQSCAIGCKDGSIGIIDISTQKYRQVIRSHTECIHSISINPHSSEFAT